MRNLGGVRLRDLATSEHVYQLVHPNLRQDFPVLRSLEATPNNLPLQVTSFIGRERELAEIKHLIGNARLLTLLGMGGLGKTRLSVHVASAALDDRGRGQRARAAASMAAKSIARRSVRVSSLMPSASLKVFSPFRHASISGSLTSVNDPVEQAFYRAALAGVFVAASAGNCTRYGATRSNSIAL